MTECAFHPEAILDLEEVWGYIAGDSPDAADRVVNKIVSAVEGIVKQPHQGHRRPDLTKRPLRFFAIYEYLIAYAPDERPVWVIAVLHGRRHPRLLAAMLKSRSIH